MPTPDSPLALRRPLRLLPLLALLFASSAASAQFGEGATDEHRAGIGLAASIYTGGISGIYDVTDQTSAQVILGAVGTYTSVGGRALYRFNQNPKYDVFGFAGASFFGVDGESAVGLGGGAGVEVNWARIFEADGIPPLYSTFDIGFNAFVGSDLIDLSSFGGGGSLHFRF